MNHKLALAGFYTLCALWILAGAVGNCLVMKKTQGPRERHWVLRASVGYWAGLILFSALAGLWAPLHLIGPGLGIVLIFAIACLRWRQLQIRRAEALER